MPFHIRDEATDKAVREIATQTGLSLTDAVRDAAENELRRLAQSKRPLAERVRASRPAPRPSSQPACAPTRLFNDDLSGDP